jgi:NAD(P)-dependent dehydrogenase (short-subunit alcohol dehydrogenase family)
LFDPGNLDILERNKIEPMNSSKLFRLDGKIALVTGSAQGLGKVIALSLAESGCSLILADLVYPEETARQIENIGSRCIPVQMDISDETGVGHLVEKSISAYKKVDILVNNAGISQLSYTPTEDFPIEEWDKIIRVNLRGTFLCSKYIGKQMIGSGGGSIINIATTAGINGIPRAPAYCASKAGVILLTKSLALEWAKYDIRVNAVAPHYLETELSKGLMATNKVYKALINQIPMNRFAKPEEIIGAVLFLSSPASSYITGTVIVADGGYLAL